MVIVSGFSFDIFQFLVVSINDGIAVVDHIKSVFGGISEGKSVKEFLSEVHDFSAEGLDFLFDVDSLLGLQGKDIGFHFENILSSFFKWGVVVVDFLLGIDSFLLHGNTLFFKSIDHSFHSENNTFSLGFNFLVIGDCFHNVHQKGDIVRFFLGRVLGNSWFGFINESFKVRKSLFELSLQERSVSGNPGV